MVNKIHLLLLLCFLATSTLLANDSSPKQIMIPFYTETIKMQYFPEIVINQRVQLKEEAIVQFYRSLERTSYQTVLHTFKKSQSRYQLNDWLLYDLVLTTIDKIYKGKPTAYKTLTTWFFLSKLNYDTRLTFLGKDAFLYVKTIDNIYETPMIEEGGKSFLGLTELQHKRSKRSRGIYLLNFLAAPNGRSFSFDFTKLPLLKPNITKKQFTFQWRANSYKIDVDINQTIIAIMKKYPIIEETAYLNVPFSKQLTKSLLPPLRKIIAGKPIKLQLEILASFTRSAFNYKEDEDFFGRSKPMVREEVFHYAYSDCEDRSAVFYGLVEELLHLPMLVIAFSDHLTIAVALEKSIGSPIRHKGKNYYICDPTGPSNSSEIGRAPKGYERKSFEILN